MSHMKPKISVMLLSVLWYCSSMGSELEAVILTEFPNEWMHRHSEIASALTEEGQHIRILDNPTDYIPYLVENYRTELIELLPLITLRMDELTVKGL